ncbi:MAG: response regulator transcription factor [Bdellovibrionales bacterium]|nr:response regulator transcription factor [Bdellovibrionales bacterium]
MKLELIYFDDQISNIECYQAMLENTFKITGFTDCTVYNEVLKSRKPHGILLDFHMPVYDGILLHEKIINSEHYNGCPVFFISGDESDDIRIKTLQSGGIDFFNRQIKEEELKLRLLNKIKRFFQGDANIDVGNLRFDSKSFTVFIKNKPIDLTLIEIRIMSYLLKKMPEPVPTDELMIQIWGNAEGKGKVHVHVSHLNLKFSTWNHEIIMRDSCACIVPF